MANRSILGGSPLGLIGVKSYFSTTNMSTFNAGNTRNVDVQKYNVNSSSSANQGNSLFSGKRVFRAWPNIKIDDPKGLGDVDYANKTDTSTRKTLHNDTTYDVSILNIIEKLSGTKAELRPADFAYLKNIGVYPNNRLMIARRFATPADDNIMISKKASEVSSIATLISWVPEGENFLDISFGEEWMEAEADFKGVLTDLGTDIGLGNLGGIGGAAGNALPLPGFTEIFQRQFLAKLDLIESDKANSIPAGNPNLIKQAKRRKTIGYSEAASGLKCTVNIKMVCDYELKYISGIDPTLVWMDILSMVTRFGTSESSGYGLTKSAANTLKKWANNPHEMIKDIAAKLSEALDGIVTFITESVTKAFDSATAYAATLTGPAAVEVTAEEKKGQTAQAAANDVANSEKAAGETMAKQIGFALSQIISELGGVLVDALSGLLQKYRVKVVGIINALALLPSTPWHITIGNPMRPTFCSGDMLVESVSMKLGPNLTFNDLPSSITIEFNLTNARPWGMQEIMAKFNSGYLRTIDAQKSYYETNKATTKGGAQILEAAGTLPFHVYEDKEGSAGTSGLAGTSGSSGAGGSSTTNGQTAPAGTSGAVGTSGTSATAPADAPPALTASGDASNKPAENNTVINPDPNAGALTPVLGVNTTAVG
jgi:hypothetical protein